MENKQRKVRRNIKEIDEMGLKPIKVKKSKLTDVVGQITSVILTTK